MFLKYIFDKIAAFVALIVFFPLLLIIAILIKIKMPDEKVIFKQERVGQFGRLFTMYKFRTMVAAHEGGSISVKGDTRITPLGAILRRYKLDELPELWNVLKGDMSFVGPRPDVPGYADLLEGEDALILQLRPGITGPATLKYRNEEKLLSQVENPQQYNDEVIFPDKIKLNLNYYRQRSFINDLKIIFATVFNIPIEYE